MPDEPHLDRATLNKHLPCGGAVPGGPVLPAERQPAGRADPLRIRLHQAPRRIKVAQVHRAPAAAHDVAGQDAAVERLVVRDDGVGVLDGDLDGLAGQ
ncbi:hypothetical protein ABZ569_32185 [Streptomyces albus]|uniref:hypothetical protein n=1 Tax=Streptomyces albus TaxID=1888 RepID=UPI0033F1D7CE